MDFGLLEPTETGLSKSILDATESFRDFLLLKGVHDYSIQGQGPDSKRLLNARLWGLDGATIDSQVSLYRPSTKKGDPRIWFSRLGQICAAREIILTIWHEGRLEVVNISRMGSPSKVLGQRTKLAELLMKLGSGRMSARNELLELLNGISQRGWIKAHKVGTTAVGHLLETELGISANSSRLPDFKGIEIKSSASVAAGDRVNLFAKVPTWSLSNLKSSGEILDKFGYLRDGLQRLNCSVEYAKANSQGLSFEIDEKYQYLREISTAPDCPDVAVWELSTLKHCLASKHPETFWVKAEKESRADGEYFKYVSVTNTKNPILEQLEPLIRSGLITMDHLIKRDNGVVKERGPLFKIRQDSLHLLFPQPSNYQLAKP